MLKWPGQVVIAGCQTFWTTIVSQAISDNDLDNLYQKLLDQVHNTLYSFSDYCMWLIAG